MQLYSESSTKQWLMEGIAGRSCTGKSRTKCLEAVERDLPQLEKLEAISEKRN